MGDHGNKRMRVMGVYCIQAGLVYSGLIQAAVWKCVCERNWDICIMWSAAAAFPEGTTTNSPLFYSKENTSLSVVLDTCLFQMENTSLQNHVNNLKE